MANVLVNENSLTGIADAIRGKNGSTDTYKPSEMAAAISAISGGGSGPEIPDSVFVLSGICSYWDYNGKWDSFITAYVDKWSTNNVTYASNMFYSSKLTTLPLVINASSPYNCTSMFAYSMFETPLVINGDNVEAYLKAMFASSSIKQIPNDYFNFVGSISTNGNIASMFVNCTKLRQLPTSINRIATLFNNTRASASLYYYMCSGCMILDEIINLGVSTSPVWTSNAFLSTVYNCKRLKNFTFESGKTASWKSQTLDLSNIGFGMSRLDANAYGIDASKEVKDATTYAALKDDADWWTTNVAYSRYNHDSAVATINSLPDTSAYLATAGGTNTIKFKGEAGSATDGGAINTLTEEEIAVATAKGWSVVYV